MAYIQDKKSGRNIASVPFGQVSGFFQQKNDDGELAFNIDEYIVILLPSENKLLIRKEIEKNVCDDKSLIGTTADASTYAVDDTAMDILAIEKSSDSSYKKKRIQIFEELRGAGAWASAVVTAKKWFDARKSGQIKLPIDVKGIESVFEDIANRGTGVAMILEKTMKGNK